MITISVVMSVYKEPLEWLHQSIDSILNQTFKDFEFIIISDNPSYKEGNSLLKEYAESDKRISLIFNEENIGLTKSLNKGLVRAKGEFIARMDADDIALPQRFEEQIKIFQEIKDVGVCGTGVEFFGITNVTRLFPKNNETIYLFIENCFAHSTIMAKSKLMKQYLYNEGCKHAQDYDLWFRMFCDGVNFYNIQKVLLKYRTSQQQIGSNFKSSQDTIGRRIRRTSIVNHIRKRNGEFEFKGEYVTISDINTLCSYIDKNESYYQKLIFYLAISVNRNVERFKLVFTLMPVYRLSAHYFFHLLYYYLNNKRIYLF